MPSLSASAHRRSHLNAGTASTRHRPASSSSSAREVHSCPTAASSAPALFCSRPPSLCRLGGRSLALLPARNAHFAALADLMPPAPPPSATASPPSATAPPNPAHRPASQRATARLAAADAKKPPNCTAGPPQPAWEPLPLSAAATTCCIPPVHCHASYTTPAVDSASDCVGARPSEPNGQKDCPQDCPPPPDGRAPATCAASLQDPTRSSVRHGQDSADPLRSLSHHPHAGAPLSVWLLCSLRICKRPPPQQPDAQTVKGPKGQKGQSGRRCMGILRS